MFINLAYQQSKPMQIQMQMQGSLRGKIADENSQTSG